MNRRSIAKPVFFLLIGGVALHLAWFYPRLPATIASHFDGSGRPNGWMSKQTMAMTYAGMTVLFAVVFYGLGLLFPKMSPCLFSIPYRDYWLAPERRKETLAFLADYLLWIGNATVAFIMGLMHQMFLANLGKVPVLSPVAAWIAAVYVAFLLVWVVGLYARLRKPKG